jgi:hypothetical protein
MSVPATIGDEQDEQYEHGNARGPGDHARIL